MAFQISFVSHPLPCDRRSAGMREKAVSNGRLGVGGREEGNGRKDRERLVEWLYMCVCVCVCVCAVIGEQERIRATLRDIRKFLTKRGKGTVREWLPRESSTTLRLFLARPSFLISIYMHISIHASLARFFPFCFHLAYSHGYCLLLAYDRFATDRHLLIQISKCFFMLNCLHRRLYCLCKGNIDSTKKYCIS